MSIILLLAIFLLLSISALLAAIETAITASSPGRMHKLKAEGNKQAALVLNMLKVKDRVISTMLIGNSLLNTLCTTIATGLFIDAFDDYNIGTMVSSIVMAFVIIVFVEAVPKAIAVIKAEQIVLANSSVIGIFLKLFKPVNALLDLAFRMFCVIFRINLVNGISGADEVRGVIEHLHQEGNVYKSDRDMLEGILDISDMVVSEIMIHRRNILAVDIDLPIKDIIHTVLSGPNTRIPFWKGAKDNIIGILHIKDLLKALYDKKNELNRIDIHLLLSQPWFIPENALVIKQLHAFRERKNHFACVVDEYGDLQGIITLEDILEEIVGQIQDEHDGLNESIIRKSENEFIVDGATTIRDINRELNWNLPDSDANTIAGLIIHELERIPNQRETLTIFNLNITILKKILNRIETVKIVVLQPEND